MTSKVYAGDTGTVILLDTKASLSGATALSIEAKRPDGEKVSWTATASGTSVRYVAQSGDLAQAGRWYLQAVAMLPTGAWRGETVLMRVFEEFD